MSRRAWSVAFCLAAFAAACGGDDIQKIDNKNTNLPSKAKATVVGTVTEGSRNPLEGATVKMQGGAETSTDAAAVSLSPACLLAA